MRRSEGGRRADRSWSRASRDTGRASRTLGVLLLALWALLGLVTAAHATSAAWASPHASCAPVPFSGVARPDGPWRLAQHAPSCACVPLECPNGTVEPCAADCDREEVPECRCEAWCDADGDPQGSNVCECH